MSQWSEWMAVEEGSGDSVFSIRQVLSFLRGAYRDRDYKKAERLLMLREERIKDELVEEVKTMMVQKEKKIEVEERLRMEVEKALDVKVEMEEKLMRECENLRDENLRLKGKVADVENDAMERVKELELKVEKEVRLRKKAEGEIEVWMSKFNKLELKVLNLTKDVDLLRSLAGAQGSVMETEGQVQATVRGPRDQFTEGANSVNPVSAAKHGPENCIEISSSSDDSATELHSGSKDKLGLAPVKLNFESDHGSPEVSSSRKRKHVSSINEDIAASVTQPSTIKRTSPELTIQESANAQPSGVSLTLTPPPGFGIPKPVNSGQVEAEGISGSLKFSLDDVSS